MTCKPPGSHFYVVTCIFSFIVFTLQVGSRRNTGIEKLQLYLYGIFSVTSKYFITTCTLILRVKDERIASGGGDSCFCVNNCVKCAI